MRPGRRAGSGGNSDRAGGNELDQDEADDLIPGHISTRAELDAWEQANITEALPWLRRQRAAGTLLTVECLRELHRRMFRRTWSWAGQVRTTLKSIGVPADQIRPALADLLADTRDWIDHHTYDADGIAIRSSPTGRDSPVPQRQRPPRPPDGGRPLHALGGAPFTWGARSSKEPESIRLRYLTSLRAADQGNYEPLGAFVRS